MSGFPKSSGERRQVYDACNTRPLFRSLCKRAGTKTRGEHDAAIYDYESFKVVVVECNNY